MDLEAPKPPPYNSFQPKSTSKVGLLILTHILVGVVAGSLVYLISRPKPESPPVVEDVKQTPTSPQPTSYSNESKLSEINSKKYTVPSNRYIMWSEKNNQYTIYGAEYGTYKVDSVTYNSPLKVGETVTAVKFDMKLFTDKTDCIPVPTLRRISNENDFLGPLTKQFYFASGGCVAQAYTTYPDQQVTFILPSDEKEFVFTYPAGNGYGSFKVRVQNDNSVSIE